jgi:hypothetical protein
MWSSPVIVCKMTKPKGIEGMGHVTQMEEKRKA